MRVLDGTAVAAGYHFVLSSIGDGAGGPRRSLPGDEKSSEIRDQLAMQIFCKFDGRNHKID